MNDPAAVRLTHNLDSRSFVWLWAKYVHAVNDHYHCTNCIRGPYSKRLSKHNPALEKRREITFDEVPSDRFKAIYICGVARKGYAVKKNYPLNLHAAILPQQLAKDALAFDGWKLSIENGIFLPIPKQEDLPERYRSLPPEFTTCRIFRWAVCAPGSIEGLNDTEGEPEPAAGRSREGAA